MSSNERVNIEVLVGKQGHAPHVAKLSKLYSSGRLYGLDKMRAPGFFGDDLLTLLLRLDGGRVIGAV